MKRFLGVLIASLFLASGAYAASKDVKGESATKGEGKAAKGEGKVTKGEGKKSGTK